MLPDATAGQIEWKLSYQDLTIAEVQSLSNLFTASQGEFAAFTFIDPLANLLGWSERSLATGLAAGVAADRRRRDRSVGNAEGIVGYKSESREHSRCSRRWAFRETTSRVSAFTCGAAWPGQ